MKKIAFLFLITIGLVSFQTNAQQAGDLDLTFNTEDIGFGAGIGFSGAVNALVEQPDGKIIAVGDFTSYNGQTRNRIARLNADGSLDNSFNPGTGFNSTVNAIKLFPDGKILVGGSFTSFNGTSRNRIAKLNSNGTIDSDFNPGTGFNSTVFSLAVQADQKILVGGQFASFNGTPRPFIARLESNGTLDNSLDVGTGFSTSAVIRSIVIQPDTKILIGGTFTTFNGAPANRLLRINADGSIDAAFTPGTAASSTVETILLLSDGKMYVGGQFTTFNGVGRARIVRLLANGTIDNDFNPGSGFANTVFSLALQSDGKLVVGGSFTTFNGLPSARIARINPSGAIDTEFNIGTGFNSNIYTLSLLTDGRIYTGGNQATYAGLQMGYIGRLNANGSRDFSFNSITGFNGPVQSLHAMQNGQILAGGTFSVYFNALSNNIVKLNADGSRDADFNAAGTGFNNNVFAFAELSSGIILVGGQFTTYNGATHNRIIALNSNGTLNTSINLGTGAGGVVRTIAVQPDGKILIGGAFTTFNGTTRNRIVRLNADGSIDNGFVIGTGFQSPVRSIALQSDGKILVGGEFTSYNGTTAQNRIVRLNSDGSLDNTLTPGTGFGSTVNKIIASSDQKIYVAGEFTTFNSVNRNRIARLNANGTLDGDFNPGTGFNNSVNDIALQTDGKLIAVGTFLQYGGQIRNRIARVNSDGNLDLSYNIGSGFNNLANAVTLQPDGKALIGGTYTSYNEIGRNQIARLLNPTTDIVITAVSPTTICRGNNVNVSFQTTLFVPTGMLTLELSNANGNFSNPVVLGTLNAANSGNFDVLVPTNTPVGAGYRLRVVSNTPALTGSDNGSNITVAEGLSATINIPSAVEVNASNTYQAGVVGTATSINWDMGDGATYENTPSVQHAYSAIGTYVITLTVDNGSCSFTTTQTVEVGTSNIFDLMSQNQVKAFAAGNIVVLEQNFTNQLNASIVIHNLAGQRVYSLSNTLLQNGISEKLKTKLKDGVYILHLESTDGKISKRIYISAE